MFLSWTLIAGRHDSLWARDGAKTITFLLQENQGYKYRLPALWTFTPIFFKLFSIMLPNEPTKDFFDKRPFPQDTDLEMIRCPLCGSSSTSIIHIRKTFQVVHCNNCGISSIKPGRRVSIIVMEYKASVYFPGNMS